MSAKTETMAMCPDCADLVPWVASIKIIPEHRCEQRQIRKLRGQVQLLQAIVSDQCGHVEFLARVLGVDLPSA